MYQSCHINLYPRPTDRRFYFSGTNGKTIIRTLARANNNKIELRSETRPATGSINASQIYFYENWHKVVGSAPCARAQWPRETARPTVYCISFPTREGRLENIASGHNFLYATMTLQKVAGVGGILQSCYNYYYFWIEKHLWFLSSSSSWVYDDVDLKRGQIQSNKINLVVVIIGYLFTCVSY